MALPGMIPDFVWQGGQMTDLPIFVGNLDGTEIFELVAPGDPETGLNYKITSAQLIAAIVRLQTSALVIKTGATIGAPLLVPLTPSRFLFQKTVPSNSYVQFQFSSATYPTPVMIRDISGNADQFPINVKFFGAELCDGLDEVTIATPYGGYIFNPLPTDAGVGWYLENM